MVLQVLRGIHATQDCDSSCVYAGMALATLFVTMPFVVRELIPILDTMDLAEEEAARTMGASDWQVFWNVTLPNIRYGLLYGIILTNAVRAWCMHSCSEAVKHNHLCHTF